jgi:hydrogenase maturation protein HypF
LVKSKSIDSRTGIIFIKQASTCIKQMATYHIHIGGRVQGVGFRPYVCRLAMASQLHGWVLNANNGLHIRFNASAAEARLFYTTVTEAPPANALITHHHIEIVFREHFEAFTIRESTDWQEPDLLLTPDIAICDDCRQEVFSPGDSRYRYTFTTCLNCGPRYSIATALPYDRHHTSMHALQMCAACNTEYNDINNRRHYSQTNSCPHCAIPMHLYSSSRTCISHNAAEIMYRTIAALQEGRIVAVKSTGGYLLLADACNEASIKTVRLRKQRPAKPFALLYTDLPMAAKDLVLEPAEKEALCSKAAPIVLCAVKDTPLTGICTRDIAPGLNKIGCMLPSNPLLLLLAAAFERPLIATSANISGSPIIYKDSDALHYLFELADYVLSYDRAITSPQDDSVLQFTETGKQIIIRRSRGMAPSFFPHPFTQYTSGLLAMGADMKSAFALQQNHQLYVSQYLGRQDSVEGQQAYTDTLQHLLKLVKASPRQIIIDQHPGYFVSQYGSTLAQELNLPLIAIQHHKAHFAAVMAEHDLLRSNQAVLGFVWDGTGYGEDGQTWGGETFLFEEGEIERVAHLDYFPQLLGDKMSREPRLAALSLLKHFPEKQSLLQNYFSAREWQYYQQLIQQPPTGLCSSMGRLLDGIAALLGVCSINSYEGQAAMQLEALARTAGSGSAGHYAISMKLQVLNWQPLLEELLADLEAGINTAIIARKLFVSLAIMIEQTALHYNVGRLAFSGGVFQNALLADLIQQYLSPAFELFFHRQLSPNDECIAFGQIACAAILQGGIEGNDGTATQQSAKNIQYSQ